MLPRRDFLFATPYYYYYYLLFIIIVRHWANNRFVRGEAPTFFFKKKERKNIIFLLLLFISPGNATRSYRITAPHTHIRISIARTTTCHYIIICLRDVIGHSSNVRCRPARVTRRNVFAGARSFNSSSPVYWRGTSSRQP